MPVNRYTNSVSQDPPAAFQDATARMRGSFISSHFNLDACSEERSIKRKNKTKLLITGFTLATVIFPYKVHSSLANIKSAVENLCIWAPENESNQLGLVV